MRKSIVTPFGVFISLFNFDSDKEKWYYAFGMCIFISLSKYQEAGNSPCMQRPPECLIFGIIDWTSNCSNKVEV